MIFSMIDLRRAGSWGSCCRRIVTELYGNGEREVGCDGVVGMAIDKINDKIP